MASQTFQFQYILYVRPTDLVCQRAMDLVPKNVLIAIQDVDKLKTKPPWLQGVPTLVHPRRKTIIRGSEALLELQRYAKFLEDHVILQYREPLQMDVPLSVTADLSGNSILISKLPDGQFPTPVTQNPVQHIAPVTQNSVEHIAPITQNPVQYIAPASKPNPNVVQPMPPREDPSNPAPISLPPLPVSPIPPAPVVALPAPATQPLLRSSPLRPPSIEQNAPVYARPVNVEPLRPPSIEPNVPVYARPVNADPNPPIPLRPLSIEQNASPLLETGA